MIKTKKSIKKIYSQQKTKYTCGAACLRMFLKSIGLKKTEYQLAKLLRTNKVSGVKNKAFYKFAIKYNFSYVIANDATVTDLKRMLAKKYFVIVSYFSPAENDKETSYHHYSVIWKISKTKVYFLDPWFGPEFSIDKDVFKELWDIPRKPTKEANWFIAIKSNFEENTENPEED